MQDKKPEAENKEDKKPEAENKKETQDSKPEAGDKEVKKPEAENKKEEVQKDKFYVMCLLLGKDSELQLESTRYDTIEEGAEYINSQIEKDNLISISAFYGKRVYFSDPTTSVNLFFDPDCKHPACKNIKQRAISTFKPIVVKFESEGEKLTTKCIEEKEDVPE